jgi:hypothetical protein
MISMKKLFFLSMLTSAITACGGSDKQTDTQAENKSPTVNIENITANENSLITLNATVTDDGSIASYQWNVNSKYPIELSETTSSTVSFTAPSISDDIDTFTINLIVVDDEGLSATGNATITVNNIAPTLTLADSYSVDEISSIDISPTINSFSDEIVNYAWSFDNNENIGISEGEGGNLTVTPSNIFDDVQLSLSLTITDTDGDMVTAVTSLYISQVYTPLTINGFVTDSPIINAATSIYIGDSQLPVTPITDENGEYLVNIKIDNSDENKLVKIISQGIETQSNAKLVSVLGSTQDIIEQAGSDGVLTSDENFATNVTNITTAHYALTTKANEGIEVSTTEIFNALSKALDIADVIHLATAIKVAIDKSANNPELSLLEGVENTLQLVLNEELSRQYVALVSGTEEFTQAQSEMMADDKLIETIEFIVPEKIYFYELNSRALTDNPIYYFNNDGTGELKGNTFTWTQTSNLINASFINQEGTYTNINATSNEGKTRQFQAMRYPESFHLTVLTLNENKLGLFVESIDKIVFLEDDKVHNPSFNLDDQMESNAEISYGLMSGVELPITNVGATIAYLPVVEKETNSGTDTVTVKIDKFSLYSDGTGYASILEKSIAWALTDGYLKIYQTDSEQVQTISSYTKIEANNGLDQFALESITSPEKNKVSHGKVVSTELVWELSQVTGIWAYPETKLLNHFYWELLENGDANTISTNDNNNDGQITEDEVSRQYGRWEIRDGNLVISRIMHKDTFDNVDAHREADGADLVKYHERTWELITIEENKIGVLHKHHFFYADLYDEGINNIDFSPRIFHKLADHPVKINQ